MRKSLTIPSAVLGIAFVFAGGALLSGSPSFQESFERWGYPLWFMYVTGALEVGGAVLVLLSPTRLYGALLLGGVMLGAIATHLRAGEIGSLPAPLALLALAAWVAWRSTPARRR